MTYLLNKKKGCLTKRPIDRLNDKIIKRLRVSPIKWSFDNWMYVSNNQNANFYVLTFDDDQRLITIRLIYGINDDIVEGFKMFWSLTYIQIEYKNNKSLVWFIDRLIVKTVHVVTKMSKWITYT